MDMNLEELYWNLEMRYGAGACQEIITAIEDNPARQQELAWVVWNYTTRYASEEEIENEFRIYLSENPG